MLLLLRERLLELPLRLPLRALGLLLLLRLGLLRPVLLRPLEAVPRLELLLLRDDEPDLEEEEELRDAIACSFGRLISRPSLLPSLRPQRSI